MLYGNHRVYYDVSQLNYAYRMIDFKMLTQTGWEWTLGLKVWYKEEYNICLCLSEETLKLKAGDPFYLVSMPGEVKDPPQEVNV